MKRHLGSEIISPRVGFEPEARDQGFAQATTFARIDEILLRRCMHYGIWNPIHAYLVSPLNVESGMGLHYLHTWISVKTEINSTPDTP